jgi:hypothetical protein
MSGQEPGFWTRDIWRYVIWFELTAESNESIGRHGLCDRHRLPRPAKKIQCTLYNLSLIRILKCANSRCHTLFTIHCNYDTAMTYDQRATHNFRKLIRSICKKRVSKEKYCEYMEQPRPAQKATKLSFKTTLSDVRIWLASSWCSI